MGYNLMTHIQKISQHPVVEFRCQYLQKGYRTVLFAHAEHTALRKLEARRRNEILGGQPDGSKPVPGELKVFRLIHMEDAVEHLKPLFPVHAFAGYAQPLEVIQNVVFDPFQSRLGCFDIVRLNAEAQIFGFSQAICALGQLVSKHLSIFFPDAVIGVVLGLNMNSLAAVFTVGRDVEERELKADGTVEIIEKITPAVKDGRFVIVLRQLVVDVLKTDAFCVIGICYLTDAVGQHPQVRNAVLCGDMLFALRLGTRKGRGDLFSLRPAELTGRCFRPFAFLLCCFGQSDESPCPADAAVPTADKNYGFHIGAVWALQRTQAAYCAQQFPEAVRFTRT